MPPRRPLLLRPTLTSLVQPSSASSSCQPSSRMKADLRAAWLGEFSCVGGHDVRRHCGGGAHGGFTGLWPRVCDAQISAARVAKSRAFGLAAAINGVRCGPPAAPLEHNLTTLPCDCLWCWRAARLHTGQFDPPPPLRTLTTVVHTLCSSSALHPSTLGEARSPPTGLSICRGPNTRHVPGALLTCASHSTFAAARRACGSGGMGTCRACAGTSC